MSTPATPAPFAPIAGPGRIAALDVVRGFALLGIFLMNIEWFSRPVQEMGYGIDPSAQGLDRSAAWLVYVVVQGKFWVLFSLLFGMGFAVMSSRGGHGPAFRRVYLRRCLALLVFGLLHAALLWSGDILHAYALAGLALLAFGEPGNRARLLIGLLLYGGTAALVVLAGLAMQLAPPEELAALADGGLEQAAAEAASVYATGSYPEVVAQRLRDFGTVLVEGSFALLPMALGVFMLGAWLVRTGRMHDIASQRGWFLRLLLWSLPAGTVFLVLSLRVGDSFSGAEQLADLLLASGLMLLASLPLALAWLSLLVLGLGTPGVARVLSWLAPAGRMALTNYLLQSLVASTLFFGYGFGLWGQVGRAGQVGLVLAVFVLQVLASHWWLARYRFGPMEGLWRWLSYGARPQLRRS